MAVCDLLDLLPCPLEGQPVLVELGQLSSQEHQVEALGALVLSAAG
jgi:hypothetical protein